jgi:hypothetical protein
LKNLLQRKQTRRRDFQNPPFPGFSAHDRMGENAEFRTLKHKRGMATWDSPKGVSRERFLE